ncbi:hypothetical protein DL98DRAFT_621923 [Cadophora sp. DSE1049]|nr:hypothetical protein DL98DRAFT_621923 [Cadophora sp. DSE1049]
MTAQNLTNGNGRTVIISGSLSERNVANREQSTSDYPPAYDDEVHFPPLAGDQTIRLPTYAIEVFPESQSHARESSIAESLPGYSQCDIPLTTLSPPGSFREVHQRVSFLKKYRRGILIAASLLVVALLAGVIGGIIARNTRRAAAKLAELDPTSPNFLALAAAQCEDATFVFWQTNVSTDIWIAGSLKTGTWNGTSSGEIPPTRLELNLKNQSILANTNLTAICWREEFATFINVHFFFYLAPFPLQLTEGRIHIPISRGNPVNYSPIAIVHTPLATLASQGSLAATYLPSHGIKLYYLYISGEVSTAIAEIKELSYFSPADVWNESTTGTYAHDKGAGLAVVSVYSPPKTEVYVFFVNEDIVLSTLRWTNVSGWDKRLFFADRRHSCANIIPAEISQFFNNQGVKDDDISIIHSAISLIAVCQSSPSATQLYFIQNHHPRGPSFVTVSAPDYDFNYQKYDMRDLPDAIQHPGLVAATSDGRTGLVQLFYVARDLDAGEVNGISQKGMRIVNVTVGGGPKKDWTFVSYFGT